MMKVSTAAVSFLLLLSIIVALGSKNEFSSRGPYYPAQCCFTYVSQAVPRQHISSYYKTSSQCTKPGIIFITKKGHYICASPRNGWVQDYIKELEE